LHRRQTDRSGDDLVAVTEGQSLESDVLAGGDPVFGPGRAGEFEPAADVVVVDVGFEHVGDPHVAFRSSVQDAIDVALRVDDDRDAVPGDEVAAVTQPGGLDDRYVDDTHGPDVYRRPRRGPAFASS
jgi:hypothetical protein